jgi:hypothetical protein
MRTRDSKKYRASMIPVIPFSTEMQQIRETVETGLHSRKSLASRINSG